MATAIDTATHIINPISRPNRFEVDIDAITHNIRTMRKFIGPGRRMFLSVKANAYNFGIEAISDAAIAAGVDAFGLVSIGDAVRLRERGVRVPILNYPGILPNAEVVAAVSKYELSPTISSRDEARAYSRGLATVKAFVKIDVGYERNGVAPEEGLDLLTYMRSLPNIVAEGVYAHIHLEDNSPLQYLEWQFQRFMRLLSKLESVGMSIPVRMAASSTVLQMSNEMLLNSIDVGQLDVRLGTEGSRVDSLRSKTSFSCFEEPINCGEKISKNRISQQQSVPFGWDHPHWGYSTRKD